MALGVAAKLAEEFADHTAIALAHACDDDGEKGWFAEHYREWQRPSNSRPTAAAPTFTKAQVFSEGQV